MAGNSMAAMRSAAKGKNGIILFIILFCQSPLCRILQFYKAVVECGNAQISNMKM
jgi:hypothetical protein